MGDGGKIKFEEKDGIDYAATTVQLPGGERVPMLFTVKELVATASQPGKYVQGLVYGVWCMYASLLERVGKNKNNRYLKQAPLPLLFYPHSTIKPGFQFGGSFSVPSYRTGLFLDPKGRGAVTGA